MVCSLLQEHVVRNATQLRLQSLRPICVLRVLDAGRRHQRRPRREHDTVAAVVASRMAPAIAGTVLNEELSTRGCSAR